LTFQGILRASRPREVNGLEKLKLSVIKTLILPLRSRCCQSWWWCGQGNIPITFHWFG